MDIRPFRAWVLAPERLRGLADRHATPWDRSGGHIADSLRLLDEWKRLRVLARESRPAMYVYEQTGRLGVQRGTRLNPFSALASNGILLALGSDAPVTPVDPWASVRAAVHHRTEGFGISPRAAFTAHTRGGWRAAGLDDGVTGALMPGAPATYAVWETGDLVVTAPDSRVQRWSTDPRAGVPALPDLSPGAPLPRCQRTVLRGRTIYVREPDEVDALCP